MTKKPKTRADGAGPSTTRRNERKEKPVNKAMKKKENMSRDRPEAVLIKPAEGVSYTGVFKNLKNKVKPDERVKFKGDSETNKEKFS